MKNFINGLAVTAKAAAIGGLLATPVAAAVSQVDQARIVEALAARGFTGISIDQTGAMVKVEATRAGREFDFTYNSVNGKLTADNGDDRASLGNFDQDGTQVAKPRDLDDHPGKGLGRDKDDSDDDDGRGRGKDDDRGGDDDDGDDDRGDDHGGDDDDSGSDDSSDDDRS